MNRTRAALALLWPSLLLLLVLAGLVLFAWYPYPFRQFGSSGKFALLLILAATAFGPALIWLVFKPGKWGLLFDIWVIVLMQLAAIGWGAFSLYQNRPFFMVHTVDQFEVLSQRDVDTNWITDPKFLEKPFVGPILLYANMPTDPVAYQKLIKEIMFEGKPDLQFRPEFWSLYAERQQFALQYSRPLLELREAQQGSKDTIDNFVKSQGREIDQFVIVPVQQKDGQFTAILDAANGEVVGNLMLDPRID